MDSALAKGASDWYQAALLAWDHHLYHPAFESARHAAELAAKAILMQSLGSFPERHDVSSDLERAGLMPTGVNYRDLRNLLNRFTLGTYGFEQVVHRRDAQHALRIAKRMVQALGTQAPGAPP